MTRVSLQLSGQAERRSHERQTMILRVGLLEQAGSPTFCLVRNISSTGMQVKLYSSAVRPGGVAVRVADENPIAGQIVWIENHNAGISFDQNVNPATLLRLQQKLDPVRRRSTPRIKAASCAALHVGGRIVQAVLQDISSMGARVITSHALEVGVPMMVRLPDLPELKAYVRWTERFESGLIFETPIPMQVIAQWVQGRIRLTV